jgi:carbamate kinase
VTPGWRRPDQWPTPPPCDRPIRHAIPGQLRTRSYPAGSMGPKVEAAYWFVEATGRMAATGRLDAAPALLDRTAGTIISP